MLTLSKEAQLMRLTLTFRPKNDRLIDSYRILDLDDPAGDCDDFAITVAYIESYNSFWKMLKNLWSGKIKLYRVYTESNEKHLVCWVEGNGFIDNRYLTYSKALYPNYRIRHARSVPVILFKMLVGLVV